MRPRTQLKHDGREAQVRNRFTRSFAFVDDFLQCRTDEHPQALIRCANDHFGFWISDCDIVKRSSLRAQWPGALPRESTQTGGGWRAPAGH